MASQLRFFQSNRKYYQRVGIYLTKQHQNYLFNTTNIQILLALLQLSISSAIFLIFEAQTTYEISSSFYVVSATLSPAIYYIINIHQRENISKLMEGCEKLIERSKSVILQLNKLHMCSFIILYLTLVYRRLKFCFSAIVQWKNC